MSDWRVIPGLPMYEASDDGKIRSKARTVTAMLNGRRVRKVVPGRVLAQSFMTLNGQPHYATAKENGRTLYVHRLVALAWHSDTYFEGAEVNHKNGNRRDNRPCNLEWTSHRANILHSYRTLKTPRKTPADRARSAHGTHPSVRWRITAHSGSPPGYGQGRITVHSYARHF